LTGWICRRNEKKNQKNKNTFPFKLDQQNGNEIDFGETNEILEK
jgi:hypothetical protein